MGYYSKLFITTGILFLLIDLVWLLVISKQIYQNYLGDLLGTVKIVPAAIFYLIYIVGIVFFVIHPALDKGSLAYGIFAGGLLGLLCYSTYDLTNLATLKGWPVFVTVIDLIWGTFITATTSGLVFILAKYLKW
ncbi:DUF2177 family protein [Carnobacterium gallinarum]|uniref:DUF2177 family protein n=1 Tax=Carnobacterium gallinarum TaxID=2749 RepID=UPI000556F4DD|nr:DUF2177 family protein [Carnobacterium gallinarum]